MTYIQFDTEQAATLGADVVLKAASRALAMEGYGVDPTTGHVNTGLRGGVHVPCTTVPDVPLQGSDGKWYVVSPKYDAHYNTQQLGNLYNILSAFGAPTTGIPDTSESKTGREWLMALWPRVGLGTYKDDHTPTFPEPEED